MWFLKTKPTNQNHSPTHIDSTKQPSQNSTTSDSARKVNFASDLHDGRPGFATSQNLPGKHQLGENGFRQNLQGDHNSPDSGYFSIHH